MLEEDEDDESEWQEPARTVFDRDATPPFKQGIEEESKISGDFRNARNFMIQDDEDVGRDDSVEDSDCSSGESDEEN